MSKVIQYIFHVMNKLFISIINNCYVPMNLIYVLITFWVIIYKKKTRETMKRIYVCNLVLQQKVEKWKKIMVKNIKFLYTGANSNHIS